jgi:hypothetical protein
MKGDFPMRQALRLVASIVILILTVTGFEVLAQSTSSDQKEQAKQQEQMKKNTNREKAGTTGNTQPGGQGRQVKKRDKSGSCDNQGNRPQKESGYGSNSGKKRGSQDGTGRGSGGRGRGGGRGNRN